jgi:hypothetical protein
MVRRSASDRNPTLWRYRVFVDGAAVGALRRGAVLDLDLDAGSHTLEVRCGSRRLTERVEVRSDRFVEYDVTSAPSPRGVGRAAQPVINAVRWGWTTG